MDRSKRYNDNEIRRMTHDAISSGAGLDQTDFRGGNTLLHEAVQNDLEDCVIKLLSAGADPNVKNAKGETPFDIALDGGNQLLMHLLSRREEYRRQVYHGHDPSSSWQNFAIDGVNTVSLQVIYEDYWDWSDTTKIHHLYKLIDEAKGDEIKYQQKLQDLIARKSKSGANLQKLQELLKKKEIRQRTRRWDIKDIVKRNLHAVDIISDDLERLKKLLEKVHSTVYWRGIVEIRRYKGFIFQRWREASLIVTGSMLIVDYSRDHEEHRVSPEDGEDTSAVSTSPYASSTSMSMSHHHHQYYQHQHHSHRTQSVSHHSSTSMSWSDGPLRRQFRHLSSSVSSSSTPATTSSSSSSLSSSGRRIYHIPIRNLRRLHIHKIPGQHGLDYEIKLSYSDEPSPAGTTTSGVSMAAHFSSTQQSTVTTRSPSTFLSASYSAAWTSFTTGGDDALTSAAAAGDGRTRSRSGERESFCSPDASSEKLKTLHLRKVSSSGSSSSGGNSSQMDHLPHTLKSLHADVAILVTMEGSTGNFSEPALDDYDMDELYAADPDEDSNLNEKTRLLLLAAAPLDESSLSSSAAGAASAAGSTKRSRRATLDTIHYPAETSTATATTALSGNLTARDSFFADDDGVSEIDGSGILTRSPVDRNSSLTGHSSNLSNLFRAVAASDRSSIGSSLSHASSGATSMESLATLTSAIQTRRVSSQLSGIEEEDDNMNRSRVSSSSSVHSALGSPRADTTAALSTATVMSPQGLHQALHMAVTDDGGSSYRETVGSKTSVDAADTTMAHDFWRVSSTTTMTMTAAAPVPAAESVTSRGAGSAAATTMAVSLDTAFATGAGGSSSSSFLHSQPWRRDGSSATTASTATTAVTATASSSVERGSSHPPSMLVPPLAQSSPERTGTLRFPGPLPTSLSALSPPSTSRTPFDTARTTHSATTASSCQSAGGGRGGGSLLRTLPDTASSQGQLSNHSLSSLPSPYRLRGKAIRLRAIPDRTIALDNHRQYRSPRLHDSMVQQIDYVRMLRWLQEQTKTVRDEMKEQLHYAILHREELKQEYEYLFLLRQLAGNPPQAPTSVFRIRRTAASATTAATTATSAAVPTTTTAMKGDAASSGGVGSDGAALAATFEEAVTLLTKYTDHVDEQARLQDWLPSGGDTGAMRSPPRRSMHTIQSTYPSQQSQQSLAAAISAAHTNANANARTPIATTMATSSSSFSEARELLQYLTRSEHHLSDLLPAATAAAAVGAAATAQRPKDCGSGSRVSPWRGALSQQQRRSSLHANGGGVGDDDELQSLRMRLVYDDDGTGAGGSSESQLRDTTVSLSVADDDFVSTRGSYSYTAAAYTTRVASSAIDRPSDLSNRPSLSSLRAAAEMSIAGTGHHYDDDDRDGDDDGDRDEAIAAAAVMSPSAVDIDRGNGSGGGGGIVSWRNKLGPPPPAYRKYFEKLLSNVEQIWNCELESYETFKKLASSIVLREETLHRITTLRAKQRDVVTSSHRNTVVAPPQDELYEVEI